MTVDVGLFLEALLYFETVAINIDDHQQLTGLLRWFQEKGELEDLLALVREGTVEIYEHSFIPMAIEHGHSSNYRLFNGQSEAQAKENSFEERYLTDEGLGKVFPSLERRERLVQTFGRRVTEVKAIEFGNTIENANADYLSPRRNEILLQSFVDELFRIQELGPPPQVGVSIEELPNGGHRFTYNIDLDRLAKLSGLEFHKGSPMVAGAICNRLIWSAAQSGCDLFLPRPMGNLVGDKLYESAQRVAKAGHIVEELKREVEFPDIRQLGNAGKLGLKDIVKIRANAEKFRRWLQSESERDRNALIAYHNETAKELGVTSAARKALSLFGVIGGGAVGALLEGSAGAMLGATSGAGFSYLADVVSKMGADWKPVVFGDWLRDRIGTLVD